jgi:hypothetical protein
MSTPAPALTLDIATDKTVYSPGETMTVTLNAYAPVTNTVTASAQDPASGTTVQAQATVQVNVPDATAVFGIEDTFGDSFTVQSNAGGTGVYTAVITPPAAS